MLTFLSFVPIIIVAIFGILVGIFVICDVRESQR